MAMMVARAAGARSAAPTPWAPRATISMVALLARPLAKDAAVNRASPVSRTRRRPNRSAVRPPKRVRPPVHNR